MFLDAECYLYSASISLKAPTASLVFTSDSFEVVHDAHTPDFSGKTSNSGLIATSEHGKILNIVAVSFKSGSVSATSSSPCAETNITVCLVANAYVVASCSSPITLTGLVGSSTSTDSQLTGVTGLNFETYGDWNANGTFIIQLTGNLLADTTNCFAFILNNPTAPQEAQTITIPNSNVITGSVKYRAGTAVDCYTGDGSTYAGSASHTVNGRECQDWSSDAPHAHSFNSLPSNYCRNLDGSNKPWCYTVDPDKRWEYCDIPVCTGATHYNLARACGADGLQPCSTQQSSITPEDITSGLHLADAVVRSTCILNRTCSLTTECVL